MRVLFHEKKPLTTEPQLIQVTNLISWDDRENISRRCLPAKENLQNNNNNNFKKRVS